MGWKSRLRGLEEPTKVAVDSSEIAEEEENLNLCL